ncbi:MAG: nucleotidyl transferase AbiEii/AbiGii toxin family protein [Bacteroidales bacterium]|nr:nucleotidyl transferase AbiEii/AbiGii toxin family protein [Bacteroidales bacterium]
MNLSVPDYKSLYLLQDKALEVLENHLSPFYLTGGTALGRYYLDHRFSDDLDFFVNRDPGFKKTVNLIYKHLVVNLPVDTKSTVDTEEFVRIWVGDKVKMKLEFVNDTGEHWGPVLFCNEVPLDNPGNILANKLGAMLSRDEAKDVFDIVTLSESYSFNWRTIYERATLKQLMNEEDVLMRLTTFPVEWLSGQLWLKNPVDQPAFQEKLNRISSDFLLAGDNSLGAGKIPIEEARPAIRKRIYE